MVGEGVTWQWGGIMWYVTRNQVNFPEELEGNVVGQGSTKALAIEDAIRLGADDIRSCFVQEVTGIDPVSGDAMFFTSERGRQ